MYRIIRKIISKSALKTIRILDGIAFWHYNHDPFGKFSKGSRKEYLSLWRKAKSEKYPDIDRFESHIGYAIQEQWFHELALQTQVVVKKSGINYQHGRLLYSLLSSYVAKHQPADINILETGTARGFASLCMARALFDQNVSGRIFTIDPLPHERKMFWNCIADTNGPKTRYELLAGYNELMERYVVFLQGDSSIILKKLQLPRVHFAFLDSAHTYNQILTEFQFLKTRQVPGDFIFFDDYTPKLFPGIVRAVDEICNNYSYRKEIIALSEQRGYAIAHKI